MSEINEDKLRKVLEETQKGKDAILKEEQQKQFNADIQKCFADRQIKYVQEMEELRNKHKIKTREGESTLWKEVEQMADNMIHQERTSMNDWASGMFSLLLLFTKLNEALFVSQKQFVAEAKHVMTHKHDGKERELYTQLKGVTDSIKTYIAQALTDNKVDVPDLHHSVRFSGGKVVIDNLQRADNAPLDPGNPANKAFEIVVALWLQENGYEPKAGPAADLSKYYHKTSTVALDEATFNALKNHPENGLDSYLKVNFPECQYASRPSGP